MVKISEILADLGLTSKASQRVFRRGTRDVEDLTVWRDDVSGIIFIDDFYVGNGTYESGVYRTDDDTVSYEDVVDTDRRLKAYRQYYAAKDVCDVGCGAGRFIQAASEFAANASAVELQSDFAIALNDTGVPCAREITALGQNFDTVFMFQSFEHMNEPLKVLSDVRACLRSGGQLVVEVPHANDFLISELECSPFIDFTLWSQHLVLHTRDSLKRMLRHCGFQSVSIESVQRYPLSNHLHWLNKGAPGGHKSPLSAIDSPDLNAAYENALRKIDRTDTLVAIAQA